MEFTKEYWVLVSSLNWADKDIPGGLKCFSSAHSSEPCIVALKQDLRDICKGLTHDFSEKEKSEWSSKLTHVFGWKWVLECKDFQFLKSISHYCLGRFKALNLDLCYEVIKGNNWASHFCDFLQLFNTRTYMDLLDHFLTGILSIKSFPSGSEDLRFFVDFTHHILMSFEALRTGSDKVAPPCSPVQDTQADHSKHITPQQRGRTLELLLTVMSKIFQAPGLCNGSNFQLEFLAVVTFLNCLSALWLNSICSISSVDGAPPKRPISESHDKIMTYEVATLCLGGSPESQASSADSLLLCIRSFTSFCSAFFPVVLAEFGKASQDLDKTFVGYSPVDTYSDMCSTLITHLRGHSTSKSLPPELEEGLASILETMAPLDEVMCKALEAKRLKSFGDDFQVMVSLARIRAGTGNQRELFRRLLRCQVDDEGLKARKTWCLIESSTLIDDAETFLGVLNFATQLQEGRRPDDDEMIKGLRKALVDAYSKFDWSLRDDVIFQLNQSEGGWSILDLEETSELRARWKPCLNRISNAEKGVKDEMSSIVSLLLLSDVRSVFDLVLSEVIANGRIIKVIASLLSRFPKTLTLESGEIEGISIFFQCFVSTLSASGDPKRNLSSLMLLLILGEGSESEGIGLLDFGDFSRACVIPTVIQGSEADLQVVELFLQVMKKTSTPVNREIGFVFFSVFVLLCTLLGELHLGGPGFVPRHSSTKAEFGFKKKCLLFQAIDSWKEALRLLFSEDSTFKELLRRKLKEFDWWTQNHFLDCLCEKDEPQILPQTLQGLLKFPEEARGPIERAAPWRAECTRDLLAFVEISQHCLDFSMTNFDLKLLAPFEGEEDVHDSLVRVVCRKLRLSTHSEWVRACRVLMELATTGSAEGSSNSEAALAIVRLLCDCMYLLRILREKREGDGIWDEMPWQKVCQYLKSFIETFLEMNDSKSENHLEIARSVGRLVSFVPMEHLTEVMGRLIDGLTD